MFDFDPNRCDRCGNRYDDIGLGGCFCPPEERLTVSENSKLRITATDWLLANRQLQERNAKAEKERRRAEDARIKAAASKLVDDFMTHLQDGNDPWGSSNYYDLGTADRLILSAAASELDGLGYRTRMEHPTHSTWKLLVARPNQ